MYTINTLIPNSLNLNPAFPMIVLRQEDLASTERESDGTLKMNFELPEKYLPKGTVADNGETFVLMLGVRLDPSMDQYKTFPNSFYGVNIDRTNHVASFMFTEDDKLTADERKWLKSMYISWD